MYKTIKTIVDFRLRTPRWKSRWSRHPKLRDKLPPLTAHRTRQTGACRGKSNQSTGCTFQVRPTSSRSIQAGAASGAGQVDEGRDEKGHEPCGSARRGSRGIGKQRQEEEGDGGESVDRSGEQRKACVLWKPDLKCVCARKENNLLLFTDLCFVSPSFLTNTNSIFVGCRLNKPTTEQ